MAFRPSPSQLRLLRTLAELETTGVELARVVRPDGAVRATDRALPDTGETDYGAVVERGSKLLAADIEEQFEPMGTRLRFSAGVPEPLLRAALNAAEKSWGEELIRLRRRDLLNTENLPLWVTFQMGSIALLEGGRVVRMRWDQTGAGLSTWVSWNVPDPDHPGFRWTTRPDWIMQRGPVAGAVPHWRLTEKGYGVLDENTGRRVTAERVKQPMGRPMVFDPLKDQELIAVYQKHGARLPLLEFEGTNIARAAGWTAKKHEAAMDRERSRRRREKLSSSE